MVPHPAHVISLACRICCVMDHGFSLVPTLSRGRAFYICAAYVLVAIGACRDRAIASRPGTQHDTASEASRLNAHDSTRSTDTTSAADVVRRYYGAICSHAYDSAYALWEGGGTASHQTRADFASGFANTVQVQVTIGDSVRIGAAAGSQYATVPVVVEAVLRDGRRQHFEGSYILRRSFVDGATPEQRRWHIYAAHLTAR